ncbi:MerR family transcriptional regulator [Planomonospora parontospora subsp. parontospora]|uniref:MerR family transcriptional regulator n=2 Tax=Planomonospora parontospora TaxID=58119 RepID=A0AA37F321_9ACTN|nr:MerR family transcriptional regulator [Planomonospora parontospora]GGK54365.1 MerR family transcriptional regulator [Planomonospora parontospora]GII07521.1 MerR family transcriptional regulator [Planomonospora parontospora subsp. parontospora]
MDGDALYSIGDLARRTGLTVKAIRFYSDCGIVPPADRSPVGHRRYGIDAVARLDLVRTLRDLGVDLPTIRRVLDREVSLPEVAAAHAAALSVQIRTLRLRRAVLTAVAERGSTPEEMSLMHRLAKLSEDERHRLIRDFLDSAFGDLDTGPGFTGIMRSMTPHLPDDPTAEQVEAWVELAELSQDPDFRALMRRTAEQHAAERLPGEPSPPRRDTVSIIPEQVGPALAAGIDPVSPQADPIVSAVTARCADLVGRPDDTDLRHWLLTRLETAGDPRRERYLRLLAVINGWPAPESLAPVSDWFVRALRVRLPESAPDTPVSR